MVVVVRRGPARPVMTGLLVGGAVARSGQRRQQQARTQEELAQANAKANAAQLEAERARKEAAEAKEAAKEKQQAAVVVSQGNYIPVQVVVPAGLQPGQAFNLNYQGSMYSVSVPAGVKSGDTMTINIPAPTPTVTVAAAQPQVNTLSAASSGKDLLREAMLEPTAPVPPPPASLGVSANELVLVADHLVDENSPTMKQYNIISIPKGTTVTLVEGDLVNGLGGAYKDYIKVVVPVQGGRLGMISRLVVKPAAAVAPSLPPPAIGGF